MKNMFSRAQPAQAMPDLPEPAPIRMPRQNDPDVLAAAKRTRESFMRRRGRQATIMTDNLGEVIGSSGQRLGG